MNMTISTIKNELQNILSGKSEVSHGESIQAITSYLRESFGTSEKTKENESSKSEETKKLIEYINAHHLWSCDINFSLFISAGAEQRVFIKNTRQVLKLNDAIYYVSWVDYFNNLLLNNYFFPDTAYNLVGFYKSDSDILYALVEQNYIESTQATDLNQVREFLLANGFNNTRNNDYLHTELGIILEDLHDENVLTAHEILYFIDTVFYIKPDVFWRKVKNIAIDEATN
jgi:putative ubiquitin-RnfH superfamily antitoxin RatB of RatAB toxin-antitoxin module